MACPYLIKVAQVIGLNTTLSGEVPTKSPLSDLEKLAITEGSAGTQQPATDLKNASNTGGVCPFGFHRSSTSQQNSAPKSSESDISQSEPELKQEAETLTCPYGFGSNSGPKLSFFHCPLCKSFLHDCVSIQPCGHKFCSFCIQRFHDCPICGIDIGGCKRDAELQDMVEKMLEAHQQQQELPAEVVAQWGTSIPSIDPATFFLRLGIQSLAGGNLQAAYDRLETCKKHLQKQMDSLQVDPSTSQGTSQPQESSEQAVTSLEECSTRNEGSESTRNAPASTSSQGLKRFGNEGVALAMKLNAVYGSQGDVCRRLGNATRAAELYNEGADHLADIAEEGEPTVVHALSVTRNKLGDLAYVGGDLESARSQYEGALDLRSRLLTDPSPSAQQMLDVAVCHAKVADICEALSSAASAQVHAHKARELAAVVTAAANDLDAAGQAKFSQLLQILDGWEQAT